MQERAELAEKAEMAEKNQRPDELVPVFALTLGLSALSAFPVVDSLSGRKYATPKHFHYRAR
jgi:hypothetical protein